mmetsp:Transcript_3655/g.6683  ORF Transcript_3655/g.6683 Transcript_3655/m.6683 type:complete len:333 (-) Transcript_3655:281-1279(-)
MTLIFDDDNSIKMKLITDMVGLARFILSPECKSVIVLTGAGVSVASGIPDFRSPGGMYDTLRPELITATDTQRSLMALDPTYVVEKGMFMENAFPYLEVRRPFILGVRDRKWKPTIAHHFFNLLHTKTGKLTRVFTQNIDGLTNAVNLPDDKIVSVHGTIGKASCETCGKEMNFDAFCEELKTKIKDIYNPQNGPKESEPIRCKSCGEATVKPQTVLFGSSLPTEFFERAEEDLPSADLLIVAGTSLVVSPANSLVMRVPQSTHRVVVNNEPVGKGLGIDYGPYVERDFFAQGNCDDVFLDLICELGWLPDLKEVVDNLPKSSVDLIRAKKD